MTDPIHRMRILVAIASYGTNNDSYLRQLIDEYRSMPYQVDLVVVSNIPKSLGDDVEVIVGLPAKNPWSLPFAHKQIFADRLKQYDLFIYSEDDTLITKSHIEAFLRATKSLKPDEIAGFLRSEQDSEGTVYYSTVHSHYHWDVNSVCQRGEDTFAFFTNEHGACYLLTQDQLRRAIASGGFLVPPHEGNYDLLVTAATDPYTQCGFKKLVCISRLQEFTCKHLTNKYIGKTGLQQSQMDIQIAALKQRVNGHLAATPATRVETRLIGTRWSKHYYEPCRNDLLALLPQHAKRVLSLGCGWGRTEEQLVQKGVRVTAVPLDAVIGQVAANRGVQVVATSLEAAPSQLRGETFDALLVSGLVHLLDDPAAVLRSFLPVLATDAGVVVSCPNLGHLATRLRYLRGDPTMRGLHNYETSGVHRTSPKVVRRWFESAGFRVMDVRYTIEGRWKSANQWTLGLCKGLWAGEFAIAGKRASSQ